MILLRPAKMPDDWRAIHPRLSPAQPAIPGEDSFALELTSLGPAWAIEDDGEVVAIGGCFSGNKLLWGALSSGAPIGRIRDIAAKMVRAMPGCRALVRLDFQAGHRFARSIGLRPVCAVEAEGTTAMLYEEEPCCR